MTSAPAGEILPRHLMFVLEGGEVVIQRGANLVEDLESNKWRVFSDFERDHNITDEELRALKRDHLIQEFDETTIWLFAPQKSNRATYYYINTHLSAPYLGLVKNLLASVNLDQNYTAGVRAEHVAIMGIGDEPFNHLPDAEAALTLLSPTFKSQNLDLTINTLTVDSNITQEMQALDENFDMLIHETPVHTPTIEGNMVLIVENDPELAEHYTVALQNLGIDVRIAHTGEAALQIAIDEEPDLVLMNLMLPDIHGYEVIAKLRKDPLTAHTNIIVMSEASSQQDVAFALYVAKVDDFLVKPLGPKILRKRVLGILMQKQW